MIPFARMLEYGNVVEQRIVGNIALDNTITLPISTAQYSTASTDQYWFIGGPTLRRYTFSTGTWDEITGRIGANSTRIADGVGMCCAGNRLYVFGGGSTANTNTVLASAFDMDSGTWVQLADIPVGTYNARLVYDGMDKIYMQRYRTLYVYTISTNTWNQLASPDVGPTSSSSGLAGFAYCAGALYLIHNGGMRKYNISTNTWSACSPPPVNYLACWLCTYNTKDIFCTFGNTGAGFWKYDTELDSYTQMSSTMPLRSNVSSTTLISGTTRNYVLATSVSTVYRIT